MRAVAVRKFRDAPELMDLPKPSPGPGEVLVHVATAGVNPFDWKILDGALDGRMPHVFPLIAGVDGAGTVEAVGPGVSRFAVGDGIFGQFLHPPVGGGTYAEFAVVPEGIGVAKIRRGMDNAQAAAVPTSGMTAVQSLDMLGLSKGQTLVLVGAAGGIGSFATQLAANAGVLPLVASRGPHQEYLKRFGAYRFFDTSSPTWREEIRTAYPGGVDGMLNLYERGPELLESALLVKPGGTVASTIGAADPTAVGAKGRTGLNVGLAPKAELLDRIGAEFATGRLQIPLEQIRPLAEGPAALAESRAGTAKGKVVLRI